MLNKTPLFHQSLGACVFLSFFLSLSLSLRLILWSIETRRADSPAWASKTLSRRHTVPSWPPQEGAWCLHERRKLCVKSFIVFLLKPKNINLFLCLFCFLIINSGPPGSDPLKDLIIHVLNIQWNKLPFILGTDSRGLYFSKQETYGCGLGTGEAIGNQKFDITVAIQVESCDF